ncbi:MULTISPECIES: M23 family metallopeptidase [Micromonospora]|uniref:Peptidase M23 n=1 Tax=Micromonospora maris TaxID=1003110 RepID=A0A9X0I8D2_9ACTN|nr:MULTISPECIES: M23 family metallopeptidase [Micromonospora]KUJ48757.1 peptidase M23 [Micromonospora maris]RUL92934.1 M23 family metallopeptidase [Verrucosispora sp. FIM060022]
MVTRSGALCALLLVPLVTYPPPPSSSLPTAMSLAADHQGLVVSASALVPPSRVVAADSVGRYRWPVDGQPRPVRRFDPPPRPWLAGHRGVDLLAPAGATIRAAGDGTISYAGMVAGRPVISVAHADGLRTTYEPVEPAVTVGTSVHAGTVLGVLLPGHAGCPQAACLHWGLRRGDDYLDPLALLGLGRTRLLPLADAPLSAGRAGWAVARRAGRTRRASCTPGRTVSASPARPKC